MTSLLWSSDFALYHLLYLIYKHLRYLFSFTLQVTLYFCRSLSPIFHAPVILPGISYPIKQECITLWIFVQSDTVNDLLLFVGHHDLYFMVQ